MELTDAEIDAANERGRIAHETQPRAQTVHYDAELDRVIVDLTNGATFAFPPRLVEGLHGASLADIADVEVSGAGYGLHWPHLDEDYSVSRLMNGIFGTAKWIAAKAERTTSDAEMSSPQAKRWRLVRRAK